MSQSRGKSSLRVPPYLFILLAVLCVLGTALLFSKILSLPKLPNAGSTASTPLTVRLVNPRSDGHWPVGASIPIAATAVGGQPIQSMELWVDGALSQRSDGGQALVMWNWTLPSLGQHTLLVRVQDVQGHLASSNVIHVIGIKQDLTGMYAVHKSQPGETLPKLATQFGTTAAAIAAMNPSLNTSSPIPDGTDVKIPAPVPPQAAPVGSSQPNQPPLPYFDLPQAPFQPMPVKYDKAYYYLSLNNGTRRRIPEDPNAFLTLQNGMFNVNDQINAALKPPAQGQETVDLDAWGWQGGSLVHIGDFQRTFGPVSTGTPAAAPVNPQLEVCSQPAPDCGQYQSAAHLGPYSKLSFQWSAAPGTYGIYQVWSFPLLASQACPINDPGVIQSGLVGEQNGSNKFTIDFTQFGTATAFSVRVLALDSNGHSICQSSNIVPVDFGPPPIGQMPDPYTISIDSLDPGKLPDPGKPGCVILTKNDFYPNPGDTSGYDELTAEWIGWYAPFPVGSEVCPAAYQPPADPCADSLSFSCAEWTAEQEGNLVENGVNQLSQDYASLKNDAVGQIEGIIPGCSNSGSLCDKAVRGAVDAGLAALGVPPSLPNSDELKQQGISFVADQVFEQVGASCTDPNDPCNQLVQMGHDQAKEKIVAALTQALEQQQQNQMAASNCASTDDAHNLGIEYYMCVPPAIAGRVTWIPAPDWTGTPGIVTLHIARDPNVPDSALPDSYSCTFKIHSSATNDSWTNKLMFLGSNPEEWLGTQLQSPDAGLFNDVSQSIPQGVSTSGVEVPVKLTPHSAPFLYGGPSDNGFWIDDHWGYDYFVCQEGCNGDYDDWGLLFRGANATFNVTESCTSAAGSFQDAPKAQQSIQIGK